MGSHSAPTSRAARFLVNMPPCTSIVNAALALRRSHPRAPVRDVLSIALQGVDASSLDFGPAAMPPHPFALLVAEAFDDPFTPREWVALLGSVPDPAPLLAHWRDTTWARFLAAHRA